MPSNFELNCLIWGLYSSNRFKINIERTESVNSLIMAIKKEICYQGNEIGVSFVDITIPNEGDDIEAFRSFERAVLKARLCQSQTPSRKLSEIFRDKFINENLHVVVFVPPFVPMSPLELVCMVHSEVDGPSGPFVVKIDRRETVDALRKTIKQEAAERDYVLNRDFKIWKVSTSINDSFEELVKDIKHLPALDRLSVCFPVLPIDGHVNIVVEGPKARVEEKRDTVPGLKKRFSVALATISNAIAPAESGKLAAYMKSQSQDWICDGRYEAKNPRIPVAPPVQLFHPIFAHFLDAIEANSEIPEDITAMATTYMREATAVYAKEADKRNRLGPILDALLDVQIANYDNMAPDGVVELQTILGNFAVLLVKEDKNEFGDGDSDPSTQVGLSMVRSWIQPRFESIRNRTCCPTFLIVNGGAWIAVLGAVFIDVVIIQPLTDYIRVGFDSALNDKHCERVARVFYSLRESLTRLKCYYNELEPVVNLPSDDSRFFPAINAYRDDDGKIVTFEYKGYLKNDLCCVTLLAERQKETMKKGSKKQRIQETEKIVVKFVVRYGIESHELLAKMHRAPTLYYYGKPGVNKDPTYGNIKMVVMEYIDGMTVSNAVTTFGLDHVQVGLEDSLRTLHEGNRVFGDLRLPNIIVTNEGRVMLIDFDWAGDHGKTRYPKVMSEMIQWAKGVGPAAVMRKEHDIEMERKLLETFGGL